ncbi:hypothetical protein FMO003_23870 [Moritella sp. F3]|nr:hypothetical protein FMO001_24200 [Moritella sp. F1]GIC82106.1 hypothetical protein FMO003_23870 [Moritella sp. F3]
MSNIEVVLSPSYFLPVVVTSKSFNEILQDSVIYLQTCKSSDEPKSIYLEIGECRESTSNFIVEYLDKKFPSILNTAFSHNCEVIEFRKRGV